MTVLYPDAVSIMKALLLTFSDVTDRVENRVFEFQIPQQFVGTDCIVISESPNVGGEPEAPITHLSLQIVSFSKTLATSRDIDRIGIFPNIHQYVNLVTNSGSESFADTYSITILQSQSPITIQDSDYIKEYWQTISEYDIFLRY